MDSDVILGSRLRGVLTALKRARTGDTEFDKGYQRGLVCVGSAFDFEPVESSGQFVDVKVDRRKLEAGRQG